MSGKTLQQFLFECMVAQCLNYRLATQSVFAEYESASCILFSHQFQDEQFHVLLVNMYFLI